MADEEKDGSVGTVLVAGGANLAIAVAKLVGGRADRVVGDAGRGRPLGRRHPQPGLPADRAQAQQEAGRRPAPVRLRHGALLLVAARGGRDLRARRRLLGLRGHPGSLLQPEPVEALLVAYVVLGVSLRVRGGLLGQGRRPAARGGGRAEHRGLRAHLHHPRPDREDGRLRGHRRADRHHPGRGRDHPPRADRLRASGTAPPRSPSACCWSWSRCRWARPASAT